MATAREIGDQRAEGAVLGNLGNVYFALGDACKAIEYHEQSMILTHQVGDQRGEGDALYNSALAHSVRDRAVAIVRAKAALAIYEAIENPNAATVRAKLAEWRGQA